MRKHKESQYRAKYQDATVYSRKQRHIAKILATTIVASVVATSPAVANLVTALAAEPGYLVPCDGTDLLDDGLDFTGFSGDDGLPPEGGTEGGTESGTESGTEGGDGSTEGGTEGSTEGDDGTEGGTEGGDEGDGTEGGTEGSTEGDDGTEGETEDGTESETEGETEDGTESGPIDVEAGDVVYYVDEDGKVFKVEITEDGTYLLPEGAVLADEATYNDYLDILRINAGSLHANVGDVVYYVHDGVI